MADEPITDVEGMLMDDETAKRVEKDWIANQPYEKLIDTTKNGVPQGFVRFSWLRSTEAAQYWWMAPCMFGGMLVFSLCLIMLTEGWMDHDSIVFRLFFGLVALLGAGIGFYIGWRLNRKNIMVRPWRK